MRSTQNVCSTCVFHALHACDVGGLGSEFAIPSLAGAIVSGLFLMLREVHMHACMLILMAGCTAYRILDSHRGGMLVASWPWHHATDVRGSQG